MTRPTVVILDDDPTGTQAVADLAVITVASEQNIAWALEKSPEGFFILTNSRSLEAAAAEELTRTVVQRVLLVAGDRPIRFISRSDSTLRGHIVVEPNAIADAIAAYGTPRPRAVLFAPAFPTAGRVTRDGLHYLTENGISRLVHETHYAEDATFGFTTSSLPELVQRASDGQVDADDIVVLAAEQGHGDLLADVLEDGRKQWIVADAETEEQLAEIVRWLEHADPDGNRVIVRCSPGLLPALLHRERSEQIPLDGPPQHSGGLIIVGSHVAQTTKQLERLLAEPDVVGIELDVASLADATLEQIDEIIESLVSRAVQQLDATHVVISSSRTVLRWDDPARSLAFARVVSRALVEVTGRILGRRHLAFLIAKGGITSSDIVTKAVGAERAFVRGRVGAGIVWEPVGARRSARRIALVPGNIGDVDGLFDAVRGMSHQRAEEE